MSRKKKNLVKQDNPSIKFILDNINSMNHDITTKITIIEHIRNMLKYHYHEDVKVYMDNGNINLSDLNIDINAPLSIRFLNDFSKKISQIEQTIIDKQQRIYLSQYINKLVQGQIKSIGINKICIIKVLDINVVVDNNKFLKGDIIAIDKEYSFIVKENNDSIFITRNDSDYIINILKQYFTEYDADKIIKIYRNSFCVNYIYIDADNNGLKYYTQRYLNNIDYINEDIGYEKVKFINKNVSIVHFYLEFLGLSKTFYSKHTLCGIINDDMYIITDKINIWKDNKQANEIIDEIYRIDKISVHVLTLANDRDIISNVISQMCNITVESSDSILNNIKQIKDIHKFNMSFLLNDVQIIETQAINFMNFIIDFYLYEYDNEVDINKYIINYDRSILHCLIKNKFN
ncbi:hypothetical protein IOLA_209 [uncultured bacterium]|nr:hypothetical protein IOLA_209 [uncultured bacterium]